MSELTKTYEQIALERYHVCTGCNWNQNNLSHSHLIPKSYRQDLKAVKENITYHCLDRGETKGCHEIWSSVEFWTLSDAFTNMKYIYSVDPTYFWLKLNHAFDSYQDKLKKLPSFPLGKREQERIDEVNKAIAVLELLKKIAA